MNETVEWESRIEHLRALDCGRVLAITPTRFRGKSSGLELGEQRIGCIVTVQGGKIVRTEAFPPPEEALEAAGLEE